MMFGKEEEKAFQVVEHMSYKGGHGNGSRGRGIRESRGYGYGRGCRGREENCSRDQLEGQSSSMSRIKCYYCKRYGHKEDRCWDKQRDEQEKGQTNFAQNVEEEESRLF